MEIARLILKKLNGGLSESEAIFFDRWIKESEENGLLFSRLKAMKVQGLSFSELEALDSAQAWIKVTEKWEAKQKRKNKKNSFDVWAMLKYAAIFLGVLGLGYGYWQYNFSAKDMLPLASETITLQLENGEVRVISPGQKQLITDEMGNLLGTKEENVLDYTQTKVKERLIFNTLNVPNGKRFKIVLSDGSSVQLNAGSSLKYPVKFIKNEERHVYLKGEAYFDIEKDEAHPFIVTSGTMDLRVLGTQFNVSAYPEDIKIKTVLVEGAVSLYPTETKFTESASTELRPGQKGAWSSKNEKVAIEKVDTSIYTSWRDGKLVLKKVRFENIVNRLQRHYNVIIANEYLALDERVFTATFDVETIEEVLDTFREETHFEFQIRDDKITIYEPR